MQMIKKGEILRKLHHEVSQKTWTNYSENNALASHDVLGFHVHACCVRCCAVVNLIKMYYMIY